MSILTEVHEYLMVTLTVLQTAWKWMLSPSRRVSRVILMATKFGGDVNTPFLIVVAAKF